MKKFYSGLIATVAIGAAATTLLATVTNPKAVIKAEKTITAELTPVAQKTPFRTPAKTAADGDLYWTTAHSVYDIEGEPNPQNGVIRQYGTSVKIDGEKATIHGLIDLHFGEIEEEFPIEGVYNDITNTITITTKEYSPEYDPEDYAQIAEVYIPQQDMTATLVLIAGDMNDYGEISTQNELVLKLSDDRKTLTSRTGFGAYAFSEEAEGLGIYDYYQKEVTMNLSTPDSPLAVSVESLDFNGLFICQGLPVKQTLTISNPASQEVTFNIESSSPELTTSITEGTIPACSTRAVEVTLLPTSPGIFEGALTISSSNSEKTKTVSVNVEVWEQPDYTKITEADSEKINFEMSPVFPFVISEFDGHVAAMSTNNGKGDNTQSWFSCTIEVPAGKTGIFSWDAAQIARQPNSLVILVDNEEVKYNYYSQSSEPEDMSGVAALSQGSHTIAFVTAISLDWSIYDNPTTGYVWGLDYQLVEDKPNSALLLDNSADFGTIYFDKLSVETQSSVTLLNTGNEPLKVTGISGNGNFSGSVPEISVPKGGEIEVPLLWTATAVGEDKADVTISTTAGDFTVSCIGIAETIPYDYSSIVTEGEISFTTDKKWPFIPSPNGKYFYNSSSKADIDGQTFSWIDATFEVPEGSVGIISWNAYNDSEDLFVFMDTPSVISGTFLTIDGQNEEMIGGIDVDCSSNAVYEPNQLTFRPGRHNVKFNYKKTSNEEDFVYGEDRLILSAMALKLVKAEDHMSDISTTKADFPKGIYVGCAGHFPITVFNYTNQTPELLSSECDGHFTAKVANTNGNNLNLIIEFNPSEGKEYSGDVVIKTNIGDYTVACKGQGRESKLGTAIFYESFEYDFENNWVISDLNKDENSWQRLSPYVAAFKNFNLTPFEGNDGLFVIGYNPSNFTSYETDGLAMTPEITIPSDGSTTLQFQFTTLTYSPQTLEVLAGEGDDPAAYSIVKELSFEYPMNWEAQTVDLSEFAGKTVRIAFKAADVANFFAIDDVLVATTGTVGVSAIDRDADIEAVEFYSIDGKRIDRPAAGMCIELTRYSNGKVSTRKILVD